MLVSRSLGLLLGLALACDRSSRDAAVNTPPAPSTAPATPGSVPAEPTRSPPSAPAEQTPSAAAHQPAPAPTGSDRVAAAEPASAAPASFEGTAGSVEVRRDGPARLLHAVRAARNPGHDRVVFEFSDGVPGYHVEYVDRPIRDCGAGDVKPIEGDGWLEVRFSPASAHTEAGQPTVAERELHPRLSIVREIERTCDFEAVVTWVIGAASPNRYRAFELAEPPRLVVDIQH